MSDSATPWTVAYQASPIGFSRQEYWSGLPFPFPTECIIHHYNSHTSAQYVNFDFFLLDFYFNFGSQAFLKQKATLLPGFLVCFFLQ